MTAVRIKASQADSGNEIANASRELDRVVSTTTASGLCGWTRQGLLTVSGDKVKLVGKNYLYVRAAAAR